MRNLQTINKSKYKFTNYSFAVIMLLVLNLGFGSVNALDEKAQLKLGEVEYLNNCAACHGRYGKGDGPVAEALIIKPFDLTMISKRFDGKFPKNFVYKVINGHDIIKSHGDTDMYVWGDRYTSNADEVSESMPLTTAEQDYQSLVLGRILSLVSFLESIQANKE